ncbi:MAG: EAL domain-containing protein, partial [Gammaproteobacteria bacterium]
AAIVGMADGLGINIIAEGVENTIQSDYLESLDCHVMQGFLFSKPVPVTDFLNSVATQHQYFTSLTSA